MVRREFVKRPTVAGGCDPLAHDRNRMRLVEIFRARQFGRARKLAHWMTGVLSRCAASEPNCENNRDCLLHEPVLFDVLGAGNRDTLARMTPSWSDIALLTATGAIVLWSLVFSALWLWEHRKHRSHRPNGNHR